MTCRSRTLATALCLAAFFGCASPPSEPRPGPDAVAADLVVDRGPVPMPSDGVNIVGARIENDDLVLSLRHPGGCRAHRFALHLVLPVPQTSTPVLDLTLSHDAGGDPCEAMLLPVLRIDLRPLHPVLAPRRSATLRVYRPGAAAPSADIPYSF